MVISATLLQSSKAPQEINSNEFDRMRKADGVILKLKPGVDKTEAMDKVVYTLTKQDVKIVGVME